VAVFGSGIYAILDTDRLGWRAASDMRSGVAADYARAAQDAGAVALQLRCKSLPLGHPMRRALAEALKTAVSLPLFINDDGQLAMELGLGVHLGQGDGDAREMVARPIGWSTHNLAQVAAAVALPVDYLGFGPVRATTGKAGADPETGWATLEAAVVKSAWPVVAIGGLERADLAKVRASGAWAAAVIGAWLGPSGHPHGPSAAGAAMAALGKAWHEAG
jgi:thiamine-phosphate pyrophosphorylase